MANAGTVGTATFIIRKALPHMRESRPSWAHTRDCSPGWCSLVVVGWVIESSLLAVR